MCRGRRHARNLRVKSLFLAVTRYASATSAKTTCVWRSLRERESLRVLPVTSVERCLWRVVGALSPHLRDGLQASHIPGIATNTTDPTVPKTHAANGLNDANRTLRNTIKRDGVALSAAVSSCLKKNLSISGSQSSHLGVVLRAAFLYSLRPSARSWLYVSLCVSSESGKRFLPYRSLVRTQSSPPIASPRGLVWTTSLLTTPM